jgi:hypothetical protein
MFEGEDGEQLELYGFIDRRFEKSKECSDSSD